MQLRHLDVAAEEAADFQRLAAPIIYADRRFRAPSDAIIRGAGVQSGLWPHAISGDRPIVLLHIDDVEDIAQVRQLLRAHEYWRMKRLGVDLVIVNERASSYIQELQGAIETAVRSSQSRPRFGEELAQGTVYTLRADLMSVEARALLKSGRARGADRAPRVDCRPARALAEVAASAVGAAPAEAADVVAVARAGLSASGGFSSPGRTRVFQRSRRLR